MKPVKICFISLNSYPLFIKNSMDYFGGAEVQMSLIAQELAKDKRFGVSLITGDYSQPPIIKQGRVTLLKTKLIDFLTVLKTIDADIYVERTINPKVFLVGWWCRLFKKKFIYMVAHDWDLNYSRLKLADLIIAQHQHQNFTLKQNLKLKNLVMPSLLKIKTKKKKFSRQYVLWVGRADEWKNPLDFIDLARHNPQEKFVMICRQGRNKTLFNFVKNQATSLTNLNFVPAVSAGKISTFFRQAKILVNTSTAEGFPNTFLQAGAANTPVLSFKVNPDKYIIKYGCGLVGKNRFQEILAKPVRLKIMGQNHYQYVKKHHSLKNLDILKTTLVQLCQ